MNKLLTTIIILITCLGCNAENDLSTADQEQALPGVVLDRCIPDSEFFVGGINYRSTKKDVISIKGKPDNITNYEFERIETFEYGDMSVEFINDQVLYLSTSSPKNGTPSGVVCGMSREEAMKTLGIKIYDKKASEMHFINCSYEVSMIFKFDENNSISTIEMGNDPT